MLKDFVNGKKLYGLEKFYEQMVVKGKAWHFGFAPQEVATFLGQYGWRLVEDIGYDALAERYVKPTRRELPAMSIERMVYTEKVA